MPAVAPKQLTLALVEALELAGAVVTPLSHPAHNPRKLLIAAQGETLLVYVYLWTLTFGGRRQLPDEYRVQLTGVSPPLAMSPTGPTVMLGYEPSTGGFAGFDVYRHTSFSRSSPSVQIDLTAVANAMAYGITLFRKSNEEIACGIRPDHLLTYVLSATGIHRYGARPEDFNLLGLAAQGGEIPEDLSSGLPADRRRIVQTVSRLSRDARFGAAVLKAYDGRCAISGLQMKLIDAAHILPVGAPGSTDDVTNGIALSPTLHRAYDCALVYFGEDYRLSVNEARAGELERLRLGGGLPEMRRFSGRTIQLPANPKLWPARRFIRLANRLRGVMGERE